MSEDRKSIGPPADMLATTLGPLTQKRVMASQSFQPEEVVCLDELLTKLMRGADVRMITRSKPFAGLMRKTKTMLASIERQKMGVQLPRGHRGVPPDPEDGV